jgi:hypothetical protein
LKIRLQEGKDTASATNNPRVCPTMYIKRVKKITKNRQTRQKHPNIDF